MRNIIIVGLTIGLGILACQREVSKGVASKNASRAGVSPSPPAGLPPLAPEEAHRLISQFQDRGDEYRKASNQLRQYGAAAFPYLHEALRSSNERIRNGAVDVMQYVGDPVTNKVAVPELIALASDDRETPGTRRMTIRILGYLKDPRALPVLGKLLRDRDGTISSEAFEVFDGHPYPQQCHEVEKYLLDALNDPREQIQLDAALTLAWMWGPERWHLDMNQVLSPEERIAAVKDVKAWWVLNKTALDTLTCGARLTQSINPTWTPLPEE